MIQRILSHRKNFYSLLIILGISVTLGILYMCSMFYYTQGHLSAPLDDTFIFLQYTYQLFCGHPFQYNTGDSPSTGATSLFYPFISVLGFLFGFDKVNILYFTFSLGVFFLVMSGWIVFNIGTRLVDKRLGWIMCLLFLFNGPILWLYLSGMDGGLFGTSILSTIYFLLIEILDERQRYKKTIVFACLMTISRPEGFILSILIFGCLFFIKRVKNWCFLIPIGLGLCQIMVNYLFSGSFSANTMQAKSVVCRPNPNILDMLATGGRYYCYLFKDIFSGFNGEYIPSMETNDGKQVSVYFAPFSLLFFVIGSIALIVKEITVISKKGGSISVFGIIAVACFLIGTLAVAVALPFKWHWHRYVIPYYSIFIIFSVLGLEKFSRLAERSILSNMVNTRDIFYGLSLFFIFFGVMSAGYFAVAYGKNCKDIYYQQVRLGQWVNRNIPEGSVIAVNDLGALKYFGNRYVIDLLGLGTNKIGKAWVSGSGSVYEFLEDLEPEYCPDYFIVYPNWFSFDKIGVLGNELKSFRLISPTIAGSGAPMVVYKVNWDLSHKGDKIESSKILSELNRYRLMDQIDVANIESEKKHKYRFWESEKGLYYGLNYQDPVLKMSYLEEPDKVVIDAGRMITGGEEMDVKTEPNKELKIIKRTYTFSPLEVYVHGRLIGVWNHTNSEDAWTEASYTIPAKYITSDSTNIRLEIYQELQNHYTCFSAYYWFYQS